MRVEFPVLIGLNGGHGDDGDSLVVLDLTDDEYERLKKSAQSADEYTSLGEDDGVRDIYEKAYDSFREEQISFVSDSDLDVFAEWCEKEADELDEDEIWDGFCEMYSFDFYYPKELIVEDDE